MSRDKFYVVFSADHARQLFPEHPKIEQLCKLFTDPYKPVGIYLGQDGSFYKTAIDNAHQLQLDRRKHQ